MKGNNEQLDRIHPSSAGLLSGKSSAAPKTGKSAEELGIISAIAPIDRRGIMGIARQCDKRAERFLRFRDTHTGEYLITPSLLLSFQPGWKLPGCPDTTDLIFLTRLFPTPIRGQKAAPSPLIIAILRRRRRKSARDRSHPSGEGLAIRDRRSRPRARSIFPCYLETVKFLFRLPSTKVSRMFPLDIYRRLFRER